MPVAELQRDFSGLVSLAILLGVHTTAHGKSRRNQETSLQEGFGRAILHLQFSFYAKYTGFDLPLTNCFAQFRGEDYFQPSLTLVLL